MSMKMGVGSKASIVLALLVSTSVLYADDLVIQSFDGNGHLTFNELTNATGYRVEWSSSAGGPWRNFTGAYGAWLDSIPATGSGVVTASVPMVYRMVATTNAPAPFSDFLVIDLSGGSTAPNYPVSGLSSVPAGGWTTEYKTTKLVMRRIPAGTYTMGSPMGELSRSFEETEHQVTLTGDFYIGVFEVTQKQWERVMGNWPSYFYNATYRESRPVEQVSYHDIRENPANSPISPNWPQSSQVHADSFMGKLRAKTGLTTLDLPTESQWEYACRAGTTTALNSGYNLTSTSSDTRMDEVGRYWYNGGSGGSPSGGGPGGNTTVGTAQVGSYLGNAWGLYDMHGNVWEWCLDWHGTYPGTVSDPGGVASGSYRVFRGGSWFFHARYCRSAVRFNYFPARRDYYIGYVGFRLAMTLP